MPLVIQVSVTIFLSLHMCPASDFITPQSSPTLSLEMKTGWRAQTFEQMEIAVTYDASDCESHEATVYRDEEI